MPFQKGNNANPKGAPRKPEVLQLRNALEKAKNDNGGVSFIEHFVTLAYKDKDIAKALANKILPELKVSEIKNSTGNLTVSFEGEKVMVSFGEEDTTE
jgi:hypothetical protein